MMSFSQTEAFLTIKMSFSYSRKNCVFAKVLTHDSGQQSKYFRAFFSVKETLVVLFDDVLVFKKGFLD